jgi:hypothetical protein
MTRLLKDMVSYFVVSKYLKYTGFLWLKGWSVKSHIRMGWLLENGKSV